LNIRFFASNPLQGKTILIHVKQNINFNAITCFLSTVEMQFSFLSFIVNVSLLLVANHNFFFMHSTFIFHGQYFLFRRIKVFSLSLQNKKHFNRNSCFSIWPRAVLHILENIYFALYIFCCCLFWLLQAFDIIDEQNSNLDWSNFYLLFCPKIPLVCQGT